MNFIEMWDGHRRYGGKRIPAYTSVSTMIVIYELGFVLF